MGREVRDAESKKARTIVSILVKKAIDQVMLKKNLADGYLLLKNQMVAL